MKVPNEQERIGMTLEDHLLTRELVDFDILTAQVMSGQEPQARADITLNQEVLAKVGTAWETSKDAIIAVVSARIKPLLVQVALHDIPQEVTVTRQVIKELIAVLDDFDALYQENTRRNQNKPQVAPAVTEPVAETPAETV